LQSLHKWPNFFGGSAIVGPNRDPNDLADAPECPDKRDGRKYWLLCATGRLLSTGLREKLPEVAHDAGTVVASRLNVATESRSMALRLHS
jgi:hypothetical protein